MNKKFLNKFIIAMTVVLFCTTEVAFADQDPAVKSALKTIVSKFVLVMLGIFAFTVLMTIGLSIYNRFFVPAQIKDYKLSKDSLRSPLDKDEAVLMFITKNRLK